VSRSCWIIHDIIMLLS